MSFTFQIVNATIRKSSPQESELDDDEAQNTTHSGSDGGGPAPAGADAKIPKKPGLSTSQSFDLWEIDIKCRARTPTRRKARTWK